MISVIVPTISGREHWLERALWSYDRTTVSYEMIVLGNRPNCSIAWNEGVLQAKGDYIHFTSDDVEAHPGWVDAALACVGSGKLPCADLVDAKGKLTHCGDSGEENLHYFREGALSSIMRMPFFPRELIPELTPVMPRQYMSDYWLAWRAGQIGWPVVVCHDYVFTHHHALEGRLYTLEEDAEEFYRLTDSSYYG